MAACADESVVEPDSSRLAATSPVLSQADLPDLGFEAPTRHLVMLEGKNTRHFERAVGDLGGSIVLQHSATGIAIVEGLDEAAAGALASARGVSLVEPAPIVELVEPVSVSAPAQAAVPASPTDPSGAVFWPYQWNMRAIEADVAWAAGRLGSSDVTVAILDTGIGYTHYDLAGRVDLTRSASFVPIDDLYVDFYFTGAHPIADLGYHGTHVAATVVSNGWVAAGVTSRTTLMGVKVCSVVYGYCPGDAIVAGILHAVDNGADVINMSLGGAFLKSGSNGYVGFLNTLFNYAKRNNVTMVVSAGNESADLDRNYYPNTNDELTHFPSLFKTYCDARHVLCVSATGPTGADNVYVGPWYDIDAPAPYTNYGRSAIDVAAPGGTAAGSVWAACSTFSLLVPDCQANGYVLGLGGTSMASPHVAGLASLAVEDVGKKPSRVRAYVRNSADAIGGGNTPFYGKGRINVANATGTN
jgi:subtilisin family serine protease